MDSTLLKDSSASRPPEVAFPECAPMPPSFGMVLMILLAVATSFCGLAGGPPLSDHEAIVAQAARRIVETGDWLIPRFNNVPFIRKPPLQVWLAALASRIVDPPALKPPVSELAARVPSALAGLLTVLVVYGLARFMFGARTGAVAGAIFASSAGYLVFSHNAQTEMLVTLFMTAALACYWMALRAPRWRSRLLAGLAVCMALGMLAKAPLPLPLVGLPLLTYCFVVLPASACLIPGGANRSHLSSFLGNCHKQLRRILSMHPVRTTALFLMLTLPWPLYVYFTVPRALPLWRAEFLDRYAGLIGEPEPFWYYVPLLFALTAPFLMSLPEAVAAPFGAVHRRHRAGLLFLFTWVVVQFGFLSTSPFKRPHYLLPVLPGIALLLAPVIERLFFGAVSFRRHRLRLATATLLLAALMAVPAGFYFSVREEPAVRWLAWPVAAFLITALPVTIWMYRAGHRAASFAMIGALPLLVFGWTWSALGRAGFGHEVLDFAAQLRSHVPAGARLVWALGRPDAAVAYYADRQIEPLFSELDMADARRGRQSIPPELLRAGLEKLRNLLEGPQIAYCIIDASHFKFIRENAPLRYREAFRFPLDRHNPQDRMVVITNEWNRSEDRPGEGAEGGRALIRSGGPGP
ncbi:MAG: hypothetical protein AMXMBFR83_20260 [Phycisphaerae bacterium]